MGNGRIAKETFYCPLCDRRLNRTMLAQSRIKNVQRMDQRICKQCETFINIGLDFYLEKLATKRWTLIPPDSDIPPLFQYEAPPKSHQEKSASAKRAAPPPRAASALEKETFQYHALSVERHIDGFIVGLESAGIDRSRLSKDAEKAVNNLLHIAQTLAGQRRDVTAKARLSRADIRRLRRHIDDVSLLVKEYITAVSEARGDSI